MYTDFNDKLQFLWNWKYNETDLQVTKSVYNNIDCGYNGQIMYDNVGYYRSTIFIYNKRLFETFKILLDVRIDRDRSFDVSEITKVIDIIYMRIVNRTKEQTIYLTYNDSDVNDIKWILK